MKALSSSNFWAGVEHLNAFAAGFDFDNSYASIPRLADDDSLEFDVTAWCHLPYKRSYLQDKPCLPWCEFIFFAASLGGSLILYGPLLVIDGLIAPLNGRKSMGFPGSISPRNSGSAYF